MQEIVSQFSTLEVPSIYKNTTIYFSFPLKCLIVTPLFTIGWFSSTVSTFKYQWLCILLVLDSYNKIHTTELQYNICTCMCADKMSIMYVTERQSFCTSIVLPTILYLSRGSPLTCSAYFWADLIITENHVLPSICQGPLKWFDETVPDPGAPTFHPWLRVVASSQVQWKSLPWLVNLEALWPGADPHWFLWPLIITKPY